jgi:hypothetical protein
MGFEYWRPCGTITPEAPMGQVVLDIKNEEKGKFLLDFLRQIDFIEIKSLARERKVRKESPKAKTMADNALLNAPILSEEEIQNIEKVGQELNEWNIPKF